MADTLDEINCPACGALMDKIYLQEHKFHVDVCLNGCGGIFLDNRELKKIDEKHENINELLAEIIDRDFKETDKKEARFCPACGHRMVKNFASAKRNIEIDECYNCGGTFLDNGELFKIRHEYNNEDERKQAFQQFAFEQFKAFQQKNKK